MKIISQFLVGKEPFRANILEELTLDETLNTLLLRLCTLKGVFQAQTYYFRQQKIFGV